MVVCFTLKTLRVVRFVDVMALTLDKVVVAIALVEVVCFVEVVGGSNATISSILGTFPDRTAILVKLFNS